MPRRNCNCGRTRLDTDWLAAAAAWLLADLHGPACPCPACPPCLIEEVTPSARYL